MKLLDHLKALEISVATFAESIDEPENTIRKIAYGQRQPSLRLAVKIAEATRGAVKEADLLINGATPAPSPQEAPSLSGAIGSVAP